MKVFLSYKIYTYRNCALVRYKSALFSKEISEKIRFIQKSAIYQ